MRFREPIKGLELEFAILSADRIVIPSIQRELSDMHIKKAYGVYGEDRLCGTFNSSSNRRWIL